MSRRTIVRLFTLVVLGCLARHVWLARYVHPMGDDWSYAYTGMHTDLGEQLIKEYHEWNGRFFSNILVLRGPLTLGIDALWLYRIVPVALMLLTLLGAYTLLRVLLRDALGEHVRWLGALLYLTLFLHTMPDIGEGFYWYTGAITYQLANALSLFFLASLFAFRRGNLLFGRVPHLLLNILLLGAIIGSDETHMLLAVVFLGLLFTKRFDRWMLIHMVMAVVFTAVVFLAPGNAVRASNFGHTHAFWYSAGMSALQTGRFGLLWTTSLPLVALSVLQVSMHARLMERPAFRAIAAALGPWQSLASLFFIIFLCAFPAYWSTGILGQHRTMNVAFFFFLPLWCINLATWTEYLKNRISFAGNPSRQGILLVLFVVTVTLLFTRNGKGSLHDLAGGAQRFDAAMLARYTSVQEAITTDKEQLVLDPITDPPRTLYLLEMRPDPHFWVDRALPLYFGRPELLVSVEPVASK